jgi:hypothetical protein
VSRVAILTVGVLASILVIVLLTIHHLRSTVREKIREALQAEAESIVEQVMETSPLTDEEIRTVFEEHREDFEWFRDFAMTKPQAYLSFGVGGFRFHELVFVHGPTFMPETRSRGFVLNKRSGAWTDLSGRKYSFEEVLDLVGFSRAEYDACQSRLIRLPIISLVHTSSDGTETRTAFKIGRSIRHPRYIVHKNYDDDPEPRSRWPGRTRTWYSINDRGVELGSGWYITR